MARTARRQLEGRHPLFGEYLRCRTTLNVWRSISAKIQCSTLHCTLHNLSYILCLSFEFALAIQLFCIRHSTLIYVTFKFAFNIQLFIAGACGAPQLSNSTHPRKFGYHVTVHRQSDRPSVRPHHRNTNIKLVNQQVQQPNCSGRKSHDRPEFYREREREKKQNKKKFVFFNVILILITLTWITEEELGRRISLEEKHEISQRR